MRRVNGVNAEIEKLLEDGIYSDKEIAEILDCDILDVEYVKRMMEGEKK